MDAGDIKTANGSALEREDTETSHCTAKGPENKSLSSGSNKTPEEMNGTSETGNEKSNSPSLEKGAVKVQHISSSEPDGGKKIHFGLELDARKPLRPIVESGDLKKLNRLNSETGNMKSPTTSRIELEHENVASHSVLDPGVTKGMNRPALQPVDTKKANRFGLDLGDSPKGITPRSQQASEDVLCDSCIDFKKKAVKSCLVCQTSFCDIHLKPHLEGAAFRDHKLLDPIRDFEARKCQLHFKTMELFCQTDQTCICYLCMFQEHKNHCTVTVEAEKYSKEAELSERQEQLHLAIMNVGDEVEKWQKEKDRIRNYTTNQKGAVDNAFKDILRELQRHQDEVKAGLEQKERTGVEQVEEIMKELQTRREELQDRQQDGDKLLHTTDAVLFLQEFQEVVRNVPALLPLPSYNVQLEGEKLTQAMLSLKDDLTGLCKKHVEKVCRHDFNKNLVERVNTDNRYMAKDYNSEWNQPESYRRFSSLLSGKGGGRNIFQTGIQSRPLMDSSQSLSSMYGAKGTYTSRMWDHSSHQTQEEPANQGSSVYSMKGTYTSQMWDHSRQTQEEPANQGSSVYSMKASSPLAYTYSPMGPASPEPNKAENSLFNMNAYSMMSRQQTPKTQPQTWKSNKQSLLSHQRPFYVNKGKTGTSNESP